MRARGVDIKRTWFSRGLLKSPHRVATVSSFKGKLMVGYHEDGKNLPTGHLTHGGADGWSSCSRIPGASRCW